MDETRTSPPRSGDVVSGDDFVSLPAGYPLARYQLIETLGQGTFGITYRAHDAQLDRAVAVKEYLPAALAVRHGGTQVLPRSTRLADDFRWGRERFLAEAQTLARFENAPAIVRVYDFLEANGTAYMVMELLRGETLEARLKRDGRLSPEVTEQLLKPLLDGLERVHEVGILHRDIKPANITLDGEGRPTLLDFGAARAAVAGRTQAMTAVYTPGYAAAEQFTSTTQGPYTDIYALSATLYQCVTGTMPPTAMERLLDDRLVPASRAVGGLYAPRLLAGIDAGLALRAPDRPATIAAWRPMLLDGPPTAAAPVLPSASPHPDDARTRLSRPDAAAQPSRPGSFRRWAIAAAVLLLVAGMAGGGYVYVRDAQERAEAERIAAEARQRELEAQRQAEAVRRQAEEQARRQAEEQALREEQARREAEQAEAQRRAEEEAKRQAQLEQEATRRQQAEAARQQQAAEEARRRAAEEARRNAEAEARRQQDEDARRRAAEEARRNTDADARRQQDEEARRRAAEEARRKADTDNQARQQQAAEEARRRAEEARRKAEADARRQQEEAARRPQGGVDGTWSGVVECYPGGPKGAVTLQVAAGQGRATVQGMKIALRISEGSVVSDLEWIGQEGREWMASMRGRPAGDSVAITGSARTIGGRPESFRPQCTLNLRRQ